MENKAFENPSAQLDNAAPLSEVLPNAMARSLPDALFPDYVDLLNLGCDPFDSAVVELSDLYLGGGRGEAFDQVVHLSEFSTGALVISGCSGAGKSTLFKALADELGGARVICSVEAGQSPSADKLFSHLALALSADVSDEASSGELLVSIRHKLTQGSVESVLLLIDDAHLLDDAVLSALLSLLQAPSDTDLPFHVVLFGDTQLIYRLDAFSLVDVLLHDIALESLSREEIEGYLLSKFCAAGWDQALPFDHEELDYIFKFSAGVLGQLHKPARQILMERITVDHDRLDRGPGLPVAHMFSLVLLLGVLIMAYFYKDSWFEAVDVEPALELTSDDNDVRLPVQALVEPVKSVDGAQVGVKAPGDEIERPSTVSHLSALEVAAPLVEAGQLSAVPPALDEGIEVVSGLVSAPRPIEAAPLDLSVSNDTPLPEPKLAGVMPSSTTLPPPAALGAVESVVPELEFRALLSDGESQLMALDEKGFVLQVMAASSKSAVEQFVAAQVNRSELQLFTTWRQGKPWYVVVTGDYQSTSEARQQVKLLPQVQRKAGPWPRSVSDIHTKIKDFRRI